MGPILLDKYLRRLTYREREVVKLFYGLGGQSPLTLKELSYVFGCSVERIRGLKGKGERGLWRAMKQDSEPNVVNTGKEDLMDVLRRIRKPTKGPKRVSNG